MGKKVFIFGYGDIGKDIIAKNKGEYEIIGFLDNNKRLWGEITAEGIPVYSPEKALKTSFDQIIIGSTGGFKEIPDQLMEMGISREKIILEHSLIPTKGRIIFLEKLGELFTEKNIEGSVAEGGVYRGNFSCEINRVFPNKKLYLFDTFSGFDSKDIDTDSKKGFSDSEKQNHFGETSEDLVISKLLYPEKVKICKGHFPETTVGIEDKFCFVNLDFDLYQPILAGLEYFYPRMVSGGVILVHDYFTAVYKGVKQAIKEFDQKSGGIKLFPIGDGISVGIYC